MSEPENFLARWSRRKQEAEREREQPEPSEPAREGDGKADVLPPAVADHPETEFDLSKLPSLDSISENTDIRAFLQKGVPLDLTRAALRRAWTSDPAIRDFIEVAENQWDFATGSDLPGFGALEPSEDLRRMVESMFEAPPHPAAETQVAKAENAEETGTDARGDAGSSAEENVEATGVDHRVDCDLVRSDQDIAAQQENVDPSPPPPTRKRHGGALPE